MMFYHLFTLQKYVNNLGHQKVFPYIVRENPYSVCHFVSRPDFSQLGLKYIELNLSVDQCVETDLVEKLDNCVSKYGISSDLLNLEITETVGEGKPEILDYNIKTQYKKG